MSKPTLGGCFFIRSGELYDYCYKESLKCLQELCDDVIIVEIDSHDGTLQQLYKLQDDKTIIIPLPDIMWELVQGKEKLAYFQNVAMSLLTTDYVFLLQADEILHEDSYDIVRKAMDTGHESFMCTRYNLWGNTCDTMLNVPQERKPCSTEVLRLAKRGCYSHDDGEQLRVADVCFDFVNDIHIFHYGFVRKKEVHAAKIKNMLVDIFLLGETDSRIPADGIFNPDAFFDPVKDLIPIPSPHPAIMKEWILHRP